MGALASSDSGGSSIQNKLGIAATTLSPEELLHQQKVFTRFEAFFVILTSCEIPFPNTRKLPHTLYAKDNLKPQVEAYVSKLTPEQVKLQQSMVQVREKHICTNHNHLVNCQN